MKNIGLVVLTVFAIRAMGGTAAAQNPTVTAIATIDSTRIDVTFSQAMSSTALTTSVYALSGSGKGTLTTNPDSVATQSGNTYRLLWNSGDMTDHKAITITVTGATDTLGHPMGSPNGQTLPTGGIGTIPVVTSIAAFDLLHIDVTFSEPMDASALTSGHYSLSGTGKGSFNTTPDAVISLTLSVYRLAWNSGDMLNGGDITITVTGTTDAAGNSQSGPSTQTQVAGGIGSLPTIASVTAVDLLHIDVTFSEVMANGSGVLNEGSYTLSGPGCGTLNVAPNSVSTAGPKTYRLAWTGGDMINGADITVTCSTGADPVGNPLGVPNSGTQVGGGIGSLPTITSLMVDSTTRMTVGFSEAMASSVLTAGNYSLSGTGKGSFNTHPDSVQLRSGNFYRLFWNNGEMFNGGDITINVTTMTDVAGNPMGVPDSATTIGGAIGTPPTLNVELPASGSALQTLPSVQVTFSETVTDVTSGALMVNGSAATNVTGSGTGPYTFTGYASPAEGITTVTVAGGSIQDTVGNPFAGSTWNYTIDVTPPIIQSVSPASSSTVNALPSVKITFVEPVIGIAAGDLTVNGSAATGISGSGAGPYDFTGFTTPPEGTVNVAVSAGAISDLAGNAYGGASWSLQLDTTLPSSAASVTSPTRAGTTTLLVDFTASDTGSGVALTHLYVKGPGDGSFVDSGLSQPGTAGSFVYGSAIVNGLYQFGTKAVDLAGNAQSEPVSADASVLLNTVLNGPFTQTSPAGDGTLLFPMTDDLVVSITLAGAIPGGDITVSRMSPIRSSVPATFHDANQLLDENLTISSNAPGAFIDAAISWPFEPANLPSGGIIDVWELNGDALQKTYAPVISGNELIITGVTGFSSWYAGNPAALPEKFVSLLDEQLTSTAGWTQFGTLTPTQQVSYDSTNTALLASITTTSPGDYRIIGWFTDATNTIYYSSVGTDRYVRAKYYVYAAGQSGSSVNEIPNFRVRVANRFAVSSILQVGNHNNADPEATNLAQDIRPSPAPASPSLYRVDLDPIDVPRLVLNPATEGFLRAFEAYEPDPQAHGDIALTECSLGTYPALPDYTTTVPVTQNGLIKSYRTSASGGGDFGTGNIQSSNSAITIAKYHQGAVETTGPQPTVSVSSAGVTVETLNVESDRLGIAAFDVFNDPGDLIDRTTRARIEPEKQYKIRFHATSTVASNSQAVVRFRARTIKFQYTASLEVGGSHAASAANNFLAAQALPGIGNQIPSADRIVPTENGGWYNVVMVTPMNPQIQPLQDHLAAQDPPGISTAGNNSKSRRDLQFGFDVIDTFTTAQSGALEAGEMTVDRVDIQKYDLVPD